VDFFARQEAARRATRWLLVAFLVSLLLVVAAIAGFVFALLGGQDGRDPQTATVWATVAGLLTFVVIGGASLFKSLALRAGGAVVARSLGGTRVERGTRDLALRRLHNVVEEMAIASGVTMPEVYVLEHEDGINAFAAGNSPADAAVAVTRGALTRLNREELQGVIAHEFSHVLNGDMRLNSRLLGWVFGLLVIAIAARILLQGVGHGRRTNEKGAPLALIALGVMAIGYLGVFVGRVLQAAVSRHRERLADASAVQFTRNPGGLVGALLKIGGVSAGSNLQSPEKEEVAHMLFAPGMSRLFSTHPPLLERVEALDPSLKREDFAARTALAARESEQLRLAPSFAERMDSNVLTSGLVQPAAVSTAAVASQVANLAGTFDETQQRYAHEARQAIPEDLHAFADSPDAARVLLFALLRGADGDVGTRQDEVLRRIYGDALLARVHEAAPVTSSLAPALRLPAVQQLFPAVRRMTVTERQEFRSAVQQLVLADDRIDVFECCLLLLLEGALRDSVEGGEEHGGESLLQRVRPAATLFAILARRGSGDRGSAQAAYDAGIAHVFPHHRQPYALIERWPEALRQSLTELVELRPSAKKVLIEGLVRTVAHDRRLSVAEGELLRTVCATLHCPLPPILSAPPPAP
jgi:Zn-dependent protease with chaperone function